MWSNKNIVQLISDQNELDPILSFFISNVFQLMVFMLMNSYEMAEVVPFGDSPPHHPTTPHPFHYECMSPVGRPLYRYYHV